MWQKCRHCTAGVVNRKNGSIEDCQACKGLGGREVPDGTPLNPKRRSNERS
jgi:hypothetical protein